QSVRRGAYIVNPTTREVTLVVKRDSLAFLRWEGSTIILQSTGSDNEEITYQLRGSTWEQTGSRKASGPPPPPVYERTPPAGPGGLSITVEQDLNTPKRVVAVK